MLFGDAKSSLTKLVRRGRRTSRWRFPTPKNSPSVCCASRRWPCCSPASPISTSTRSSARSGWVAHTSRVLLALEDIGSSLTAAESGQRGYLSTGKTEYLEPYFAVRERIPSRLADLRRLIADNPRQRARVDSLEPGDFRSGSSDLTGEHRQRAAEKSRGGESRRRRAGRGKALMDSARRLLDAMTDEERGLLDEPSSASSARASSGAATS